MAVIPLIRLIVFVTITLFSLIVLGLCAHIEYLLSGFTNVYTSFAPFGIAVSCLTIVSLPLFLVLEVFLERAFTTMILFELVWFFLLWILWVGAAGDTVTGMEYYFPAGCSNYVTASGICAEVTAIEAFAFLNFLCAFIYYDVVLLYAIINAVRGRGIWTVSVKQATVDIPGSVNPGMPMGQPQFAAAPAMQYQPYGAHPSNIPPAQPYNTYPPQGSPAQPYNAYPQQVPTQNPPQQYGAYPPQGSPTGQNPPYVPAPGSPQQVDYTGYASTGSPPVANTSGLPPQPNYGSHPANAPQAPLPLPSGYKS